MSVEIKAGRPTMPTIPQSKRPTILVYPTVTPESIIIPIVSCILGFPLLALMVICCLRRRAKLARERARRRNCDLDHGALSLVRFSPVHRLAEIDRLTRTVRYETLRSDRGSRPFPSVELDTVVEERSDPEQSTALELSSLDWHPALVPPRSPRPSKSAVPLPEDHSPLWTALTHANAISSALGDT